MCSRAAVFAKYFVVRKEPVKSEPVVEEVRVISAEAVGGETCFASQVRGQGRS